MSAMRASHRAYTWRARDRQEPGSQMDRAVFHRSNGMEARSALHVRRLPEFHGSSDQGTTLHSGADLPLATEDGKCETHTDIDQLWLKIQCLRWVLIDEISMVSAQLLHLFLERMRDATREPNTYKIRFSDGTVRLGGGYNFLFFGDWWQIAPGTGTPLFQVPSPCTPGYLENTVSIFWFSFLDRLNC